jgi:hypothetical protein
MALVLRDRVQETTTTTGTGTITLAGAVSGFQSFSVIGDANTTYYTIQAGSEWEVGIGTYTSSGTTLSRNTVLESSNSGSLVNFSAGVKNVFVTYPAEKSVTGAPGLVENDITINQSYSINAGRNAISAGPITINDGVTVTIPDGSRWVVV